MTAPASAIVSELAALAEDMVVSAYRTGVRGPKWDENFRVWLAKVRAADPDTLIELLGVDSMLALADGRPYMEPLREVVQAEIRRKFTSRLAGAGRFLAGVGIALAAVQAVVAVLTYWQH